MERTTSPTPEVVLFTSWYNYGQRAKPKQMFLPQCEKGFGKNRSAFLLRYGTMWLSRGKTDALA